MAATDYNVWLAPISAEIHGHTLTLSLTGASSYMARRLKVKFGEMILSAASRYMNCSREELTLTVRAEASSASARKKAATVSAHKPAFESTAVQAGTLPDKNNDACMASQEKTAAPESVTASEKDSPQDKEVCQEKAAPAETEDAGRKTCGTKPAVLSARRNAGGDTPVRKDRKLAAQPLVRSLPLDRGATITGDAAIRKQWPYSFDDFVVGNGNAMVMNAARDLCRSGSFVETLFVSSEPGLGKTHIVKSTVRQILEDRGSDARVAYLTGDDFYARFRYGLVNNTLDDFMERVRALDFLLVDDLQSLRGKNRTQEALLSVVKHLHDRGSRVVFASRYMARELKQLDPQLVSMVSSGIQASIEAPDYQMRCEILRRKARAQQMSLPEETIAVLADGLEGDVRTMESCLQTLLYKTHVLNTHATPEMAAEVLEQLVGPRREKTVLPTLDSLIGCVSREYGLTEQQLCSCLRRRHYVEARNVLFYLARKYTTMTLVQIGARVNKRHSTVIKGIATIEESLNSETLSGRQTARVVQHIEKTAGCVAG